MLNYETLLSNYDDRLTLLEYLKKVEAALADASATSFSVTKTGNATLKFVLTFADGSTLESPEIVLQQGESVASAAISNSHLLLTLTNGDVLDAGDLFNGNVNINGNLSLNSNNTAQNGLSYVKNQVDGSEITNSGNLTFDNLPNGLEVYYAHWKISNGELKITLAFKVSAGVSVSADLSGHGTTISLPSALSARIFAPDASAQTLERSVVNMTNTTSTFTPLARIMTHISKAGNGVYVWVGNEAIDNSSGSRAAIGRVVYTIDLTN